MKTLLFIVNPRAGRTRSMAPMFDVVARFSQAGYLIKLFITEGPGDAKRAAAELGGQFDLVVCAGGDGTLNETLCGLMTLPQRPPVGYIPHGSTNDFAASLRIPAQPMAAANAIAACTQPRRLDLGQHNGRYFACVASFALSTRAPFPPRRRPKRAGPSTQHLRGIRIADSLAAAPRCCRIEADLSVSEDEYIFGAVCNSHHQAA